MQFRRKIAVLVVLVFAAACGPKDRLIVSSAQSTDSYDSHPLVGTWISTTGGQDLVVRSNGTTISQTCGTQGTIGEVDESNDCGINSKGCGSFPYIVINGGMSPGCVDGGSHICFYNVFIDAGKDVLGLNCSDGKGVSYYSRQR